MSGMEISLPCAAVCTVPYSVSRDPHTADPRPLDAQLLLMLKMCVDAESRCDERIRDALACGDGQSAAADTDLKAQYVSMRHRLFTDLGEIGITTQDMHEQLQMLPQMLGKSGGAEQS
jgi:hypothetical protein